jgi:hypothetical protein
VDLILFAPEIALIAEYSLFVIALGSGRIVWRQRWSRLLPA